MQLIFPANKQTELAFKVAIAGTNTAPSSVTAVLERDGQALSYTAVKSTTSDEWVAVITNPGETFSSGEVKFSINVIVNSRLFSPLKTTATIEQTEVAGPTEIPVNEPTVEVPKVVEPEIVPFKEVTAPTVKPEVKEEPVVPIKVEAAPAVKLQLLKSIEGGHKSTSPAKVVPAKVKETAAAPKNIFRLKRLKIVYQD